MARRGIATVTITLLVGLALGVTGCGPAALAQRAAKGTAVDVPNDLVGDDQALAALGFDTADLDVNGLAAPAPSATGTPGDQAGATGKPGARGQEWRKRHGLRALLGQNVLHGEVVVQTRDGSTKTVAVQRGEVTAVDAHSMTVKSADGFTMTWTFGDKLRVVERRTTVQPSAITAGATVGVAGAKDGDGGVARLIVVRAPR